MTENPFFHRGPIHDPDYFYNREAEVKQVLEMVHKRQSVAIVGPRKIGKTSLLLYISHPEVAQRVLGQDRYLFMYFSCESVGDLGLEGLFALILGQVTDGAARLGYHLPIPERPVSFLDFRQVLRGISGRDKELNVVLLLDEFELLTRNRELSERLFPGLRALAQESVVTYLVVSQRPLTQCTDEYSPFFNIFSQLPLPLCHTSGGQQLIERTLSKVGGSFLPETYDGILELGGGHPFFLQVVGYWALELQTTKGAPLSREDFRTLTRKVQSEVEGHLKYSWSHLAPDEQYVLTALPVAQNEVAYQEQLKALSALCLIVKEGERYRYFSPLFRDFVRRQKVPNILQAGPFVLVLPLQRALLREKPLPLSPRLFAFLSYLVEHPGRVVSNEELDREVLALPEERQQYQYMGDDRLKSTIRELRRALGEEADRIVNKWGVGYTLEIQPEE